MSRASARAVAAAAASISLAAPACTRSVERPEAPTAVAVRALELAPAARPVLGRGRVLAWEDERPVADASVELLAAHDNHLLRTTRSGSDGGFELFEGYVEAHARVSAPRRATVRSFGKYGSAHDDFRLPIAGRIRGEVVDERGAPAPDAAVSVEWIDDELELGISFDSIATTTDASGRYELTGVPTVGTFVVAARRDRGAIGWSRATQLSPKRDDAVRCDIELPWSTTLRGRLVGGGSRSLAGFTVFVESKEVALHELDVETACDVEGRFRVDGVTAGAYVAQVVEREAGLFCEQEFAVRRDDADAELVLRLGPQRRDHVIRGRIVGPLAGDDAERIRCSVEARELGSNTSWSSSIEPDGRFAIDCYAAGEHELSLTAEGEGEANFWFDPIRVAAGSEAVEIVARHVHGRIAGRVVELRPDPDRNVDFPRRLELIGPRSQSIEVEPNAASVDFRFERLPAGRYELWLFDDEHDGERRLATLELRDDESVDAGRLRPAPAPRIRGRLLTRDGAVAHGVDVYLLARGGPAAGWARDDGDLRCAAHSKTDVEGRFDFAPNDAAVELEALPAGEAPVVASLDVESSQAANGWVEMRPTADATLRGRVVDARGFPMPGLLVSAIVVPKSREGRLWGDQPCGSTPTAADGSFELRHLTGAVTIRVARRLGDQELPVAASLETDVVEELVLLPDFVVR